MAFGSVKEKVKENCRKKAKISKEEITAMKSNLSDLENIMVFLNILNNFRVSGRLELPLEVYEVVVDVFEAVVEYAVGELKISEDKEIYDVCAIKLPNNKALYNCLSFVIILSSTYYFSNEKNEKIYIQNAIKDNKIFKSSGFWRDIRP